MIRVAVAGLVVALVWTQVGWFHGVLVGLVAAAIVLLSYGEYRVAALAVLVFVVLLVYGDVSGRFPVSNLVPRHTPAPVITTPGMPDAF